MQRCRTCHYWRAEDGRCDRIEGDEDAAPDERNPAVIYVRVADNHNLSVTLHTRPDFGCVLHEPDPAR